MTGGPYLLVSIETDADNERGAPADGQPPSFDTAYALPRLHARMERHGVRPTYLVTRRVARDPRSAEVLRFLLVRSTCDIGAHSRPEERRPPGRHRSAPGHAPLPPDAFEAQLQALTAALTEATGERPVTYRSGALGFSPDHVPPLERAGYLVDSSVTPLVVDMHGDTSGGPDAPLRPYFLSYDSVVRPGSSTLLEVPCTAGFAGRARHAVGRLYESVSRPRGLARLVSALRLGRVVRLCPSSSTIHELKALARSVVERGEPVLNVLVRPATAAVADDADERLEAFVQYATTELGAIPATHREFRSAYLAR